MDPNPAECTAVGLGVSLEACGDSPQSSVYLGTEKESLGTTLRPTGGQAGRNRAIKATLEKLISQETLRPATLQDMGPSVGT